MLISPDYLQQNIELHKRAASYGTSSRRWIDKVRTLADRIAPDGILDYGCGKGLLAQALPDLGIREYDPAIAGKDAAPEPADLVICTDVLEHIEPELLDAVLADLRRVTRVCAFLNIATRPAAKSLADGRNAHLIVEQGAWWQARLEPFFTILSSESVPDFEFNVVVAPAAEADRVGRLLGA
ncbi:class I SAM-dependent methyltransferase [uncultured Methylobacterium sp.]|jgi:2-polyprenyl-3-methyl-5-hydroxy-6-metoxy-1,4-benzoquinol methylase|uniref:class I SAM-dependent methyltransferase n=1 Tax=uncultured Methylobacterium sp. TaxID=157278 RepID=UPI00260512AB|nr:class I SAM-dependent methyltransferase [uncultured Methylobacterium sp.]